MNTIKFILENGIIGLFISDKTYKDLFYKVGYAFGSEIGWFGMYVALFINFMMFPFNSKM